MTREPAKKVAERQSKLSTSAPLNVAAGKVATDSQRLNGCYQAEVAESASPEVKKFIEHNLAKHRETFRELAKR